MKIKSRFNRSDFFEDYVELCDFTLERMLSCTSCVITSDDVFDRVLDIRRVNNGIDSKREDLLREWLDSNAADADATLHGLDDYERWKRISDARNKNKTQSQFIRSRLMRNVQERSNGESSLALFVDSIADDALYYGFSQLRTERPKQTTTRYAGAHRKLYKKILQSSTIRVFKS